jgi:hypothetical protein
MITNAIPELGDAAVLSLCLKEDYVRAQGMCGARAV